MRYVMTVRYVTKRRDSNVYYFKLAQIYFREVSVAKSVLEQLCLVMKFESPNRRKAMGEAAVTMLNGSPRLTNIHHT